MREKSEFSKQWILDNGVPIVKGYNGNITIREIYYELVAIGMINDIRHYKKVVNTMGWARWQGVLEFDAFLDHERETIGNTDYKETDVETESEIAKEQIKIRATGYRKKDGIINRITQKCLLKRKPYRVHLKILAIIGTLPSIHVRVIHH